MKADETTIALGGYHGWGLGPAATQGFQSRLEALLAGNDCAALPTGRDHRVLTFTWSGRLFFVKHYRAQTFKTRLQYGLKCSKAHKARRYASRLRQAGIETPRVVAYLQRGRWLGTPEALLVTEGVPGLTLREQVRMPLPLRTRRSLIQALARFLARIHDAGIYHGDFSAFNILVSEAAEAPFGWQIDLIDLDAIRSVKHISYRRQIKNLDELGRNFTLLAEVSVRERLRFLSHYRAARKKLRVDLATLKTAVCRRTEARMRTYGKRFVPP
jgi:tRNA A-37 threonylcarbamoyl transferase component Bud32